MSGNLLAPTRVESSTMCCFNYWLQGGSLSLRDPEKHFRTYPYRLMLTYFRSSTKPSPNVPNSNSMPGVFAKQVANIKQRSAFFKAVPLSNSLSIRISRTSNIVDRKSSLMFGGISGASISLCTQNLWNVIAFP